MELGLMEALKLFAPLLVLNYSVVIFCLFLIWKRGTENLSRVIWSLIVVFINILGPVAFLVIGRKKTDD